MDIALVPAAVSPVANTLGGQGWHQAGELAVALVLPGAIGLERELRHKDAGHGIVRRVLNEATQRGFVMDDLATESAGGGSGAAADGDGPAMVAVTMHVHGKRPVSELASAPTELGLVDAAVA